MRTPREAASAASDWPAPVVSLPSLTSTMRFCVSSGNSADASRSAPPMSVALRVGTDAIRSMSASSPGSRSTSASRPNATTAASSPPAPLGERFAHVGEGRAVTAGTDAIGQVHHEHRGQPVHRQLQPQAGERQHERREDDGAHDQAGTPPAEREVVARGARTG